MADKVHYLPCLTIEPLPPERVIEGAARHKFSRILIIGRTEDGEEYFASSEPDGGILLWDMERCRHELMKIADK